MNTTVGQLLINDVLPPELRDYNRIIDKKTSMALFTEIAEKHPEKYAEIDQRLNRVAAEAATTHGGTASLSLKDFQLPEKTRKARSELKQKVLSFLSGPGTSEKKHAAIVNLMSEHSDKLADLAYKESLDNGNSLAEQVASGARGNVRQFSSLQVGDLLVNDYHDNPVPIPVLASYSEGLSPAEYWASAYGARSGYVQVKLATPEAGYLAKQLTDATHRLIVTEHDCGTKNGIPVEADDPDNEGSVLASAASGLKPGSVLLPSELRKMSGKKILVRSPITCQAKGGVCRLCAGKREDGDFPSLGSAIGISAAQAVSEPLAQAKIGSKHLGGVRTGAGTALKSGFALVKQLVEVPKTFAGSAPVAEEDGRISAIKPAPQGGRYVVINETEHWVPEGLALTKKVGEMVEEGDALADGVANPSAVVRHKGVGAGRLLFTHQLRKALQDAGVHAHRRNLELLSRGLINHVRITDVDGPADTVPDDLVEYDGIVRNYEPRYGFTKVAPNRAVGLYLEQPVLHYSIGTRVTKSVADDLRNFGVGEVTAHQDKPSFAPEMPRALEALGHADDWMVRLGGYNLKKTLLEAAQRGRASSPEESTSFIPALAQGVGFAQKFKTIEQGAKP